MKIYAVVNDVEIGVSLNSEEVTDLGVTFAEIFSSSELTNSLMKSINDVVNAAVNAANLAEDKPEEEESEEPEEATDAEKEKLRDDYISKLRELGYPVIVEDPEKDTDEERLIECYTFCDVTSNKEKAALVRAWLKKKEIKYTIDSFGIKKYAYKLTPSQLNELQGYLIENDMASYKANI